VSARPRPRPPGPRSRAQDGFTLIELLTVIAIVGILAALVFPAVGAANRAAKKTRSRVQFSQWAVAMEQFKQEYGYYPRIDGGGAPNKLNPARFAGALTGKRLDGTPFASNTDVELAGNSRMIAFYSVGENELSAGRTQLLDAFGNADIAVLYDQDGDGLIRAADGARVAVAALDGTALTPSAADLNLAAGVRAGVIFYSAGNGRHEGDLVLSWR